MAINNIKTPPNILQNRHAAFLFPLVIIAFILLIGVWSLFYLTDDSANPFGEMYLMPWVLLVGVVIAIPNLYLIYKGRFHLFHPLTFAAWSYFVPGFFIGGLLLAGNISQPFFMNLIDDERYNLPLTLFYIALGYASLTIGFFIPYTGRAGKYISGKLPEWEWQSNYLMIAGLILLLIGLANNVIAFSLGILGFQRGSGFEQYEGILFLLTLLWSQGSFILWMCIFKAKKLDLLHYLIIAVLLLSSLAKALYQGNRGSLIAIFVLVVCTFVFSVERIKTRHVVYGVLLLFFSLSFGMIYGTTFRSVKGSESRVDMGEYTDTIGKTFDKISDEGVSENISSGITAIADRMEAVSSLAVVVSNYEKLEPYEESYGIKNNIWNDTAYFLIPRVIWKDKPTGSSPRDYSALYFNFGENSFIITPIGDLLRNFGPVGIFFGMVLLGAVLGFIYNALILHHEPNIWRVTLYYVLLTVVSFEGFFGTILPNMVRFGLITVLGLIFINFLHGSKKQPGVSVKTV